MPRPGWTALIAASCVLVLSAARARADHVRVELVADRTAVEPGGQVDVAVVFTIDPHWHTYWLNPGDTGAPAKVTWTLPQGVTATPLRFPTPRRIDVGSGLTAFGYERSTALLTTIRVPPSAKEALDLKGSVSVLVCADECIFERHDVALRLPVGSGVPNAADRFAAFKAALPRPAGDVRQAEVAADGKTGALDYPLPAGVEGVEFFPPRAAFAEYGKPDIVTEGDQRMYRVPFRVLPGVSPPEQATALVVTRAADGRTDAAEVIYAFSCASKLPQ